MRRCSMGDGEFVKPSSHPAERQLSAMVPSPPPAFTCETCGIIDDPSRFAAPNQCEACFRDPVAGAVKAENDKAREAAKLILRNNMTRVDAVDSRELVDAVMREFGGIAEFAKEWVSNIRIASITAPGSYVAIKSLESVSKLLLASERNHEKPREVGDMDDDEIEEELAAMVLSAIRNGQIPADMLSAGQVGVVEGSVVNNGDE
ncbi:MAG: hypothetical protein E6R03_16255 [Hyphomicrobiaceae bacterium]|nr:MAG: hypothetical protein E6R03_16255 [Hyphomicrobiaceae bacterium]